MSDEPDLAAELREGHGEQPGEQLTLAVGATVDQPIDQASVPSVSALGEAPVMQVIEAALMAAGKPMTLEQLAALFDEDYRPDKPTLQQALADIATACAGRGFALNEVASGWRFQVRQELVPWVGRLWDEKPQRYTRALLETLALVAYRQPITRGEIEDIRGVSVSTNIIRTLQEREWVRVVGHRDVPGRPAMYATTRQFLDYFNLCNLDQLPPLSELRDLDAVARQLEGGTVDFEPTEAPPETRGEEEDDPAAEAATTDSDAAALLSVEEAQAFHEQGNQNIDTLFAELDELEGGLTLTYQDYNPLADSKPDVPDVAQHSEADNRPDHAPHGDGPGVPGLASHPGQACVPQPSGAVLAAQTEAGGSGGDGKDGAEEDKDDEDDEDFELYRPTIVIDDDIDMKDGDDARNDLSAFVDDFDNRRLGDDEP